MTILRHFIRHLEWNRNVSVLANLCWGAHVGNGADHGPWCGAETEIVTTWGIQLYVGRSITSYEEGP